MTNGDTESLQSNWPILCSQAGKFIVGAGAGLCATIVPKMVTALATSDPNGNIVLFGTDYILISIALSGFLGFGVMVLNWEGRCVPRTIFTGALGLPAVFAGAFNVSSSLHVLERTQWQNDNLNKALQRESGINDYGAEPLTIIGNQKMSMRFDGKSQSAFGLVRTAHAQDTAMSPKTKAISAAQRFDPGRVLRQPKYLIVLKKTTSLEDAKAAFKKAQAAVPGAAVVQGRQGYYVIEDTEPKNRTDATFTALELKKKLPPNFAIGLMRAANQAAK